MDGLEAAAKILELNTGVPIVAMTANVMSNDMDVYRQSGMHDFVGKPFTSQELWRCLMKYFTPVDKLTVSENEDDMLESDLAFQKSIEKLFADSIVGKFHEITQALEEGDIKLAHRLVHTLKSSAAQIGMKSLQNTAAEIEIKLKDGKNLAEPQQLANLKYELDAALTRLAPLLDEEDQSGDNPAPLDPRETLELFEELDLMLKSGNTECVKLTGALRAVAGSGLLIRQINDFNFDLARNTLAGLINKLK